LAGPPGYLFRYLSVVVFLFLMSHLVQRGYLHEVNESVFVMLFFRSQ
jgi:hypothetical protein